jgi:hypothetical protein
MLSQNDCKRGWGKHTLKALALSLAVCFSPDPLSQNRAFASEAALELCSSKSALSAKDFQSLLSGFSMSDKKFRKALVSRMSQKSSPCRVALEQRLDEIYSKPADFVSNTGRNAALTLGLMLELPLAQRIIEAELEVGDSTEWLEMLRLWNQQAYRSALRNWLVNEAGKRRQQMQLSLQDVQNYGLRQIEEFTFDESASKRTSLVLQLYLKDALGLTHTAQDFTSLNAHYASLRPGVRKLFKDSFAKLVQKSPAAWVQAFRTERSWTQFQLLELMEVAGGAEIVRELLWLSENHIDKRMKLRAQSALNHLTL